VGYYVWPAALLWAVDRLIRAIRIVVVNFGYFKPKRVATLDAHFDVLSSDFLRITLQRPSYVRWAPGQSAYLTIPGLSTIGAHPFTISSIDILHISNEKSTAAPEKHLSTKSFDSSNKFKELTFLVRVHRGFTRRIRNAARDKEPLNIYFDGPYDSPPIMRGFETVILISGTSLSPASTMK